MLANWLERFEHLYKMLGCVTCTRGLILWWWLCVVCWDWIGSGVLLVVVGVGHWLNRVTNNSWVGLTGPGVLCSQAK